MTTVLVTHVYRGWDMRKKHLARKTYMVKVRVGQAAVLLNGDRKIARIIDSQGGVHDYYAPKGQKFDEGALYNMVERGFHINLVTGKDERKKWEVSK